MQAIVSARYQEGNSEVKQHYMRSVGVVVGGSHSDSDGVEQLGDFPCARGNGGVFASSGEGGSREGFRGQSGKFQHTAALHAKRAD